MRVHSNMRDLSGLPVGMLTVSAPVGRTRDGHIVWECHCSCGKSKNIASQSLTRKIPVQSCGCLNHRRAQDKRRPEGPWNEGKSYLIKNGEHCYRTRGGWSKAALKHYGNRCEICGWDKARCDVHHRKPKSKGGLHTIRNAIVLCPNCHRVTHEAEGTPCDT